MNNCQNRGPKTVSFCMEKLPVNLFNHFTCLGLLFNKLIVRDITIPFISINEKKNFLNSMKFFVRFINILTHFSLESRAVYK